MKANELMLGDWVVGNSKPFQIGKIDPNFMYWDEVKPIPLTPEILEKNGFAKLEDESGKQRYRWEYADGIHISIDFTDTDPWIHVSNRCYFAVPYCEYVHQLQHALRLCGIEKTIEL